VNFVKCCLVIFYILCISCQVCSNVLEVLFSVMRLCSARFYRHEHICRQVGLSFHPALPNAQCVDFAIIRQNFCTASNLKDLFHNIHPK